MGFDTCVFHCCDRSGCGPGPKEPTQVASPLQQVVALAVRAHCHALSPLPTGHHTFNKICFRHVQTWNAAPIFTSADFFHMLPQAHSVSLGWNSGLLTRAVDQLGRWLLNPPQEPTAAESPQKRKSKPVDSTERAVTAGSAAAATPPGKSKKGQALPESQAGAFRELALDALRQSAPYPLEVSEFVRVLDVQEPQSEPLPIVVYVTSPHDPDMVRARVDFDSPQRVSAQLTQRAPLLQTTPRALV
jgi:hypothetical protein